MGKVCKEVGLALLACGKKTVEVVATPDIITLEKDMLASLEGDDVAHQDLRPSVYRGVFLTRKHKICIAENGRSQREQQPFEATLNFEHCRLNILLLKICQY
jgi:hypothetical protein